MTATRNDYTDVDTVQVNTEEIYYLGVRVTDMLAVGETPTTIADTAIVDLTSGQEIAAALGTVSAFASNITTIQILATALRAGRRYLLTVLFNTSGGNRLKAGTILRVPY